MKFDEYTKLHEYIEYASEPDSFEERVSRLKEVCEIAPCFKTFFFQVYKPTLSFVEVLHEGAMIINCSNDLRNYAYGREYSDMMKNLEFFSDTSPAKPSIRYSHLLQEMDEMKEADVDWMLAMLRGDLVFERLNSLVAKEAFPDLFEQKKKRRTKKEI